MLYFLHALTTLWTHPDERVWAALELLFAVGALSEQQVLPAIKVAN